MRVLGYCCNGYGLGHLTRMTALLCAMRQVVRVQQKESPLDWVLLSTADSLWPQARFQLPVIKIPSKLCCSTEGSCPAEITRQMAGLSGAFIREFAPDILIVDTFLCGSYGEFTDQRLLKSSYTVYVNRERKENAPVLDQEEMLLSCVEHMIVPHLSGEGFVRFTDSCATDWVGPLLITDHLEPLSRTEARNKIGIASSEEALLLYAGPSQDSQTKALVEHIVRELQALRPAARLFLLGATVEVAGAKPLHYYPAAEILQAFDAAVTAAGYNIVHELLAAGIPSAFFARERLFDDQSARAQRYAKQECCIYLGNVFARDLKQQLTPLFSPEIRPYWHTKARSCVPSGGAERAAKLIVERWTGMGAPVYGS